MIRSRRYRTVSRVAVAALTIGLATNLTSSVSATEAPDAVDEWAAQFGASSQEAEEYLTELAEERGISAEDLSQDLLDRADAADVAAAELGASDVVVTPRPEFSDDVHQMARHARAAARKVNASRSGRLTAGISTGAAISYSADDPYLARSGSGGSGTDYVPLANASYAGDFFYYPVSTLGINHGHVGIYRGPKRIVEAANANLGVRRILAEDRNVPKAKTWLFWVDTSFAKQEAAAAWADAKVGAAYRSWTATKNKYYSAPFNCSQLIWGAYKQQSVELDDNGGDYVWPADIVNDSATYSYKKVG